jgi:ubiquinone/menaquinone biosynthesis C-methylase UbiE
MPRSALTPPTLDPTPIFEHFRGSFGSELLTAAVAHLNVFGLLAGGTVERETFRQQLGLAERPFIVLTTALRAMGLLSTDLAGRFLLSEIAREHLSPGADFDVSSYIGLASQSPGVLAMVSSLRSNRPAGADVKAEGAAFIFREGVESAMEIEASARMLTLALAGRAKNVAPHLAKNVPLGDAKVLLDVGGGTGIYAIAYLQANPSLKAIVWDRPEVLKVAQEMATEHGVADRLELRPGNMFTDPVPSEADVVLLSNILHDWDVQECRTLIGRIAKTMPSGGRLLIHDVFLNDSLDGPLPIALYSAALFTLTEGRAYSGEEYRQWLAEAVLIPSTSITPTLIHCGVLEGVKA